MLIPVVYARGPCPWSVVVPVVRGRTRGPWSYPWSMLLVHASGQRSAVSGQRSVVCGFVGRARGSYLLFVLIPAAYARAGSSSITYSKS
jgi:hypothetical protein